MTDPSYFVETGIDVLSAVAENLNSIENSLLEKVKYETETEAYVDLEFAMDSNPNPETRMEQGARVLKCIGDKIMRQNEQALMMQARYQKLKASIGALKFVLPAALGVATFACPILGGAAAISSIVWEVEKILSSIKEIKETIERLEESDYKSAMQRFKEDVLIKLKNDINPSLLEIQSLKEKSIDAFNKLADKKIEEKLELIKIQIFCSFYLNCYDEVQDKVLPFDKICASKQGVIRDLLNER